MTERRRRERPARERVAPVRAMTRASSGSSARTTRRAGSTVAGARRPKGTATRTVVGTRPKRTAQPRSAQAMNAAPAPPKRRSASSEIRRRRSRVATLVFAVLMAGFVVAFVYPTRTYLRQRTDLSAAETRLQVLERETRILENESTRLASDAEIERVAREQYGLLRPGETPWVLVPETTANTTAPTMPAG